jgi:hypothetical protein
LSALEKNHKYDFKVFASGGRLLAEMASDMLLEDVKKYLQSPGANPPKALLIGGGGNDVVYEDLTVPKPPPPPLLRMLVQPPPQPGQETLVGAEVKKFIDVELFGHYKKILTFLRSVTPLPILIHAYDHPIPDGRFIPGISGPWLKPIFVRAGYNMPNFPQSNPHSIMAGEVMQRLIDYLNTMVAGFASDADKIYHVNLTGTLAAHFGAPEKYTDDWNNELHPKVGYKKDDKEGGFDLLATVVAKKLDSILNS